MRKSRIAEVDCDIGEWVPWGDCTVPFCSSSQRTEVLFSDLEHRKRSQPIRFAVDLSSLRNLCGGEYRTTKLKDVEQPATSWAASCQEQPAAQPVAQSAAQATCGGGTHQRFREMVRLGGILIGRVKHIKTKTRRKFEMNNAQYF